jgi:hypothetical protein
MVDGAFADGSYYTSTIVVTNTSASQTACTLSIFGFGPERLSLGTSFQLQAFGGYSINGSMGNAFHSLQAMQH